MAVKSLRTRERGERSMRCRRRERERRESEEMGERGTSIRKSINTAPAFLPEINSFSVIVSLSGGAEDGLGSEDARRDDERVESWDETPFIISTYWKRA